jgi:hypothetical protein
MLPYIQGTWRIIMNNRILNIAAIVLVLVLAIGFGTNYYLWDKQTKDIDAIIKALETKLDEKDMVLSYDQITYQGHKSWHVIGEIVNLKIASKSQPTNFASMKKLSFENDSQNHRLRFVGDETIYDITSHDKIYGNEDFKVKVTYSGQLPTLDFYFKPLSKIDVNSNANVILKTIEKVEYNEGHAKGFDLKTNEEVYSSDSFKAVSTFDDSTEIKKLGLLINYKNLRMKFDESLPMSGPQNFNLDVNTELAVTDNNIAPEDFKFENLVSIKAIINDLTYSNDIGRLSINGTGMYDKTSFLPEINASIIIGNYEKILDYTNTLLPDLKNAPIGAAEKVPSEIDKDHMTKFKQFLSTFKMNDTDLKFDLVFEKTGNMTISGKPVDVFMQEYDALMAPPAPPAVEVLPSPQVTPQVMPIEPIPLAP